MSRNRRLKNWFSKLFESTKIGQKSFSERVWDLVTLAGVRNYAGQWGRAFFRFQPPAWLAAVGKLRFSTPKDLKWYDYWNPIRWCVWIAQLTWRLLLSRPYYAAGPGLLAIAAVLLIFGMVIKQRLERSDWRSEQYKIILSKAVERKDYKEAGLCLVNLVARHPEQPSFLFQQAIILDELGQENAAMGRMVRLASTRQHSEAAAWVISKGFDFEKINEWSEEEHKNFLKLVEIAEKSKDRNAALLASAQMAKYFLRRGAVGEAAANFAELATQRPEFLLVTATLYAQLNDAENTLKYAEAAQTYWSRVVLGSPSDKKARLNLAQSLLLLKNEEKAARILNDGFKITQDSELLQAGGEALAAWAVRIRNEQGTGTDSLVKQIDLLRKAIAIAPNSDAVLEVLVSITIECAENKSDQVQQLRDGVIQGLSSDSAHFVLGTVALLQGNLKEADFHLDLAIQIDKQSPGLLNNLAVALYRQDPPQLERALALSEAAVRRMNEEPYLRETRGQILIKLKRYTEAIPDLEFALRARELAPQVHLSLSEAYAALGQTEIANRHKALASAK